MKHLCVENLGYKVLLTVQPPYKRTRSLKPMCLMHAKPRTVAKANRIFVLGIGVGGWVFREWKWRRWCDLLSCEVKWVDVC